MTNFEKWFAYNDGLPSPDLFIEWAFYYMIGAALQRRVWCPPEHDKIYANMYVTLVGDPGVGKGGPIRRVSEILTEHKRKDFVTGRHATSDEERRMAAEIHEKEKSENTETTVNGSKKSGVMDALLFPTAADAVTYQALVKCMAESYRFVDFPSVDDKGEKRMKIYGHSSMHVCLEEKSSLFKKHTEDLINFLIQAYDAGETYEYMTISRGRDKIKKVCLSILAGTTPDFMQSTFDEKILGQGYSSRTFYIYGAKNRKTVFFRPELNDQQRQYRKEIAEHVKGLAGLYGCVKLEPGTFDFLQKWLEEQENNPSLRASKSVKLKAYYARKNIHVMKLAMALHFGESHEMYIPLETFKRAIDVLYKTEKTMHMALCLGGENKLSAVGRKIIKYLQTEGERTFNQIYAEFFEDAKKQEIEETLEFLRDTSQIVLNSKTNPVTKETLAYYKVTN